VDEVERELGPVGRQTAHRRGRTKQSA
jgi:hypothetical protein